MTLTDNKDSTNNRCCHSHHVIC